VSKMGIGFSECVCPRDWMLSLGEKDGRVDECYRDLAIAGPRRGGSRFVNIDFMIPRK
jgi:hypothetical protein